MAVKHGSVAEFDGAHDDWDSYTERLEQYFVANDNTDAGKKRAILLSSCGSGTYEIIKSLVAPEKPTEHSYAQLVKLVKTHFKPGQHRLRSSKDIISIDALVSRGKV